MAKRTPRETEIKIAGLLKAGYTKKEIAKRCGVCQQTVFRISIEFGEKEKTHLPKIPENILREWDFVRKILLGEIKIEKAKK